jgi:hypothetical protein
MHNHKLPIQLKLACSMSFGVSHDSSCIQNPHGLILLFMFLILLLFFIMET